MNGLEGMAKREHLVRPGEKNAADDDHIVRGVPFA